MPFLVHDLYKQAVERYADKLATVDIESGTKKTFRELWERARHLAGALRELGVHRGDRVVLVMRNRSEWVECDIAISMIGAIRARINTLDPEAEYKWVIRSVGPEVIIAEESFVSKIRMSLSDIKKPYIPIIRILDETKNEKSEIKEEMLEYESLISETAAIDPIDVRECDLYMLFQTSGTTDLSKGAVYTHKDFVNVMRNIMVGFMGDLKPGESVLHIAPVTHMSGLLIGPALRQGAAQVFVQRLDPDRFPKMVEQYRITAVILPPSLIAAILESKELDKHDISSLRHIYYAGAPMPTATLRRGLEKFGPIFLQGYGTTEALTFATILTPEEHVEALNHYPERLNSCGKPAPFYEVAIMDEQGNPVKMGEVGEIWIRSDSISLEYWERPDKTRESHTNGWFKTGDIARQDEHGFIYILDRAKDVIMKDGRYIYPREIEEVITSHPAVLEAAAVGATDGTIGVFVVLRSGKSIEEEELIAWCSQSELEKWKIPDFVKISSHLPKTPSGKIMRRALKVSQ